MNVQEDIIEKIEAYLDGEIDKLQLEEIANAENIQNLEEEIDWVKNTQLAIEAHGIKNQIQTLLKSEVESKKDNVIEMPSKSNRGKLASLSIAAAIALLFGVLFFFKPNNPSKLYSKYEFVDPGLPVLMSETDRYEMYEALSYYSEQNYSETLTRLGAIKDKNPSKYNDTIDFYLGVSNLYENNISASLPLIKKVSEDENSVFKQRAEWLTALAQLKSNDIVQTKATLQIIIAQPEHPFYNQALALLSELEK